MVVTLIEWEHSRNFTGRSTNKKKVNVNDPSYRRNLMQQMRKIEKYCDVCDRKYNLADPCIHNLSDSPEHREKKEEYKRKMKKAADKSKDINNQSVLD